MTRRCASCGATVRRVPVCDECDRASTCGAAVHGARCDEAMEHDGDHVARVFGREAKRWAR